MTRNPRSTRMQATRGRSPGRMHRLPMVTGGVILMALCAPLCAQSESEIRQETTRQNQRISDLRSEVAALEERVRSLEDLIRRLQESLERLHDEEGEAPTGDPMAGRDGASDPRQAAGDPPASRPSEVFRSPESIIEALKWDYRSDLTKDPSFALGVDSNSERARSEAASILASWIVQMNRKYQQQVTWSVRISRTPEETPDLFRVQALGSEGEDVGRPFLTTVSRPIARRIDNWLDKPDLERFLMKGSFLPGLTAIDPTSERDTIDDADESIQNVTSPLEISPYVQFEYSVRISTILPVFETDTGTETMTDGDPMTETETEPSNGT